MPLQIRKLPPEEVRRTFNPDQEFEDALRECEPGQSYEIMLGRFQRPRQARWRLTRAAERVLHRQLHFAPIPIKGSRRIIRFSVAAEGEENHG